MKRILFVDDDPRVLEGLRAALLGKRRHWDMMFVESAAAALDAMSRAPVDVIVTDVRMPSMDGALLLARVREARPETVRVVLSGYAEEESLRRVMGYAQLVLQKPCAPPVAQNALERACNLQGIIESGPWLERPQRYGAIVDGMRSGAGFDWVACALADRTIAEKLHDVVARRIPGLPAGITTQARAVMYLGPGATRGTLLALELFAHADASLPSSELVAIEDHAYVVAGLARLVAKNAQHAEDAFVSGLLHEAGRLLRLGPEDTASVLASWELPYSIIEAVLHHGDPSRVPQVEIDALTALAVADALLHREAGSEEHFAALDPSYLSRVRALAELPGWERTMREYLAARASR